MATWKERFLGALLDVTAGDRKLDLRERAKVVRWTMQAAKKKAVLRQAAEYGFPRSMIDAPENLVRIPRYKHWEINRWYETKHEEFDWRTPREYLHDKEWAERARTGLNALQKFGVMK